MFFGALRPSLAAVLRGSGPAPERPPSEPTIYRGQLSLFDPQLTGLGEIALRAE